MLMSSQKALQTIKEAAQKRSTGLDLSGLGLTELPREIGELTNLRILYLRRNKISRLPTEIGNLTQLSELSLAANPIKELPAEFWRLKSLKRLWLDETQLPALPAEIGTLSNLTRLALHGNRLATLPAAIGNLVNLQELYLGTNQLAELPAEIGKLSQLKILTLDSNRLETLPPAIGNLVNLQELHLFKNQLVSLPESLRELPSLRCLTLHKNGTLNLPPEVLGPTRREIVKNSAIPAKPPEILEYYFRTQRARRPLNEARLILVGHGEVGKTSLVNWLIYDTFNDKEKQTEGIQITQWSIRLHENEAVRLNIWDFGGQEIMHSTHQFFLTQRSLYLLVLNGRQGHEDADAEYWLNLIEKFGEDSPVIVVLNKMKEYPFNLNRRGLVQKFPLVRGFIQTDCADGTGIEGLRQAIERETDHLEHLRDAFPASWFAIKDRLASMRENYVTFDRYREICNNSDETDPLAQESLASYLHTLGIALNYKDDPRLRDAHVLNPQWVTKGIYSILNAQDLAEQKGELRVDDLARILDPDQYPWERHTLLLELIRKFELCFSFPEEEGRYLIPESLDKQQPVEAEKFRAKESLNFHYHYPIPPEGLVPRFIVRTHVLSTNQPRWRTGVILNFEGNRALVKADVHDKRVFIAVTGPAAGQRRLLAIIRADFEHIHRNFRFQPEEMVPVPDRPSVLVPYKKLCVLESNGIATFLEVVDTGVLELDVQKLLNGVDLEGTRRTGPSTDSQPRPLRLFYSYSHQDEELHDELEKHLTLFRRQGLIEAWHDRRIIPGDEWNRKIDENLERADIILLLVSAYFIASDYCYDIELTRALERYKSGEVCVIPVILRDVNWQQTPFARLQAVPRNGKAVTTWENRDTAWKSVAESIEKVIRELQGSG
jgi:internalin A